MAKSRNYQTDLLESLKDPVEAAEYLNAALEDGEPEVFLLALRDVVDSYGGMAKLATSTSLNRENLYRMLSTKGNPEFFSLSTILSAVGIRLAVEPKTAALSKTKSGVSKLNEIFPKASKQ
ncbi:MAG: putative addiction module antidote protein [Deltaproteobacteria bacterium RIFCSPLOWO2_12_FULL_60_19]|nr:MAG: putative addiction module antidote protein [Deltaproteobacteria bacterium RIFCSPLOWO2_12_FULL_60_19]